MVKRGLFLSVFLFILMTGFVSAAGDVAYIYNKEWKVNDFIVDAFEDAGLIVDEISVSDISSVDFSQYRLIFVGDERFRNVEEIPVNDFPSIVANYYHGDEWGLTDADGVSKLGSGSPLKVKKNGNVVQVYTRARYSIGSDSIPYYYLDDENKVEGMQKVASPWIGSQDNIFGDVISYASQGVHLENGNLNNGKTCFYGIIEAEYWTPAARDMFDDCLTFVIAECLQDSDCDDGDDYTFDECNEQMECEHTTIECFTDVDCSDGDDYTKDICENAGTVDSFCRYEEIVCLEDNDCNDSDKYTEDSCENAGEVTSFCEYEDIACFTDVDCSDGDDYTIDSCNKPGTTESFCSYEQLECLVDSDCNDNDDYTFDECNENNFCEYTPIQCLNDLDCDDSNERTVDSCENPGKVDSFCKNVETECLVDSDCGVTGFIGDNFCSQDNIFGNYQTAVCVDGGTLQADCQIDVTQKLKRSCDDGDSSTEDSCVENGEVYCVHEGIECFEDVDCGEEQFVGNFCKGDDKWERSEVPICLEGGSSSSQCSSELNEEFVEACEFGCSGGECNDKPPVCSEDSDCNDGNSKTVDECVNPGESDAYCVNTEINCASDLDCGVTGFIGGEFCSEDDVYKTYRESTCVNAGTKQSYCEVNEEDTLVNDCGVDECEVNEGKYCLEGDVYQKEVCYDKGCSEGACFNKVGGSNDKLIESCDYGCSGGECLPPACELDSDCGDVEEVKQCVGDNLEITTKVPVCSVGECSQDVTEQIVECDYGCSNGACNEPPQIECSSDAECDDSDDYTKDICVNPGTENSFCEYEQIICLDDNDCDDSNSLTDDFCINPGTTESYCDYIEVECRESSDCSEGKVCVDYVCEDLPDISGRVVDESGEGISNVNVNSPGFFNVVTDANGEYHVTVDYGWSGKIIPMNPRYVFNPDERSYSNLVDDRGGEDYTGFFIECFDDAECDDGDVYTTDVCTNPGTAESECIYNRVGCIDDIDCEDGNPYTFDSCVDNVCVYEEIECVEDADCEDGNEYTVDMCENAGTVDSFCSQEILECINDIDCDDDNDYTEDSCVENVCNYKPIQCLNDLDCGTDGFVGENFCSDSVDNLPNDFVPVTGHYHPYGDGRVGLFNSSGGLYVYEPVRDSYRLISDNEKENALGNGFPADFKPIVSYYLDWGIGRVAMWDSDGEAWIYEHENEKFREFTKQEKISAGLPGDLKPTVGYFHEFGEGAVVLWQGGVAYIIHKNGNVGYFSVEDKKAIGLPADFVPTVGYYHPFGGGRVALWSGSDAYVIAEGKNAVKIGDAEKESFGIPADFVPSAGIYNEFTNKVVLYGEDEVYEGAGNKFVKVEGDKVLGNYQSYECLNAGTSQSQCVSDIEERVRAECEGICSEGVCVDFEISCVQDSDCEDGNEYTLDECVNPGQEDSFCENKPIECLDYTDCSGGSCVDNVCVDNPDISGQVVDESGEGIGGVTIESPGFFVVTTDANGEYHVTVDYSWSGKIIPMNPRYVFNPDERSYSNLVDDRGGEDYTGFFIECFDDAECDDGDVYTTDSCVNPGTVDSRCVHDGIECVDDLDCGVNEDCVDNICVPEPVDEPILELGVPSGDRGFLDYEVNCRGYDFLLPSQYKRPIGFHSAWLDWTSVAVSDEHYASPRNLNIEGDFEKGKDYRFECSYGDFNVQSSVITLDENYKVIVSGTEEHQIGMGIPVISVTPKYDGVDTFNYEVALVNGELDVRITRGCGETTLCSQGRCNFGAQEQWGVCGEAGVPEYNTCGFYDEGFDSGLCPVYDIQYQAAQCLLDYSNNIFAWDGVNCKVEAV